jgi:uncharacterized iron-regulated membrane protein
MNRKVWQVGGIAAGAVLILFGVAALVLGVRGGSTVNSNLKNEYIVGSPDMQPGAAINGEIAGITAAQQKILAAQKKAKVPASQQYTFTTVDAPTCSVAGQQVNTGSEARCFAQYMRIHALGASSGLTYAQMGRYQAKPDAPIKATDFNGGTNVNTYAVVNTATGQPADNGVRNVWVTETALTSALNLAYTASQISLFGIVVGIALLLTGIGFLILAFSVFGRTPKEVTSPASAVVPAAG